MITKFQDQVREVVKDSSIFANALICNDDGSVKISKNYRLFFRHGHTIEDWVDTIVVVLISAGIDVVVTGWDDWAGWRFIAVVTQN